jgi:truncated hemoglobin YjbI
MTHSATLFEQLGGEARLRAIMDQFVDRIFGDMMIGFFFRHADRSRIKEMEYQLAAQFLGADVEYCGQRLDVAHAKHPIMGGHFARRRQIFKETLESFAVPAPIQRALLDHTDALRPLITGQSGSGCQPIASAKLAERA